MDSAHSRLYLILSGRLVCPGANMPFFLCEGTLHPAFMVHLIFSNWCFQRAVKVSPRLALGVHPCSCCTVVDADEGGDGGGMPPVDTCGDGVICPGSTSSSVSEIGSSLMLGVDMSDVSSALDVLAVCWSSSMAAHAGREVYCCREHCELAIMQLVAQKRGRLSSPMLHLALVQGSVSLPLA